MIPALATTPIELFIRAQELRPMSRALRHASLFRGPIPYRGVAAQPAPDRHVFPRDPGAGAGRERVEYGAAESDSEFTEAQKLALLIARGSDLARACAGAMIAAGVTVDRKDFAGLVAQKLAIDKGAFHVLTPFGRWRALQVAREVAPRYGINVRTYVVKSDGGYEPGKRAKFNHW